MSPDRPAYILWLPSWYPNKLAPYDGDFIQRHAQAASIFTRIHVLYLVRDKKGVITNSVLVEENQAGNLSETIVYYSSRNFLSGSIEKIFALRKFRKLYKKSLSELFEKKGIPSLVHAHIAFKAGIIAMWIKETYDIPFLLSEQWTIYLHEARPNFSDLNFLSRHLVSKTVKAASKIFCVSHYLGTAIKSRWPSIDYKVIPNVVNTEIFFPGSDTFDGAPRLVHISNLTYQKDPENLFKAVRLLKESGLKFSLDIFGAPSNFDTAFGYGRDVADVVKIHKEVPQFVLAEHLRRSHLLILYSRYETFGCVIIEANASGVPVMVADMPVMRELVQDNDNGVLVIPGSAQALAEAILEFLRNNKRFNKHQIAANAKKYSYSEVGKMFFDEYLSFTTC